MKTYSKSTEKTIILVGGGHTHALFLRQWKNQPVVHTKLVVFDPQKNVAYTGMLPGFIAGHYTEQDLYIDIEALAVTAGAEFIPEAVTQIDAAQQVVTTSTGTDYRYDVLSIDIGIHSSIQSLPVADPSVVVGVKPLTEFAQQWEKFVTHDSLPAKTASVAIIGGGVAGVELALAIEYRLRKHSQSPRSITILERHTLLTSVSKATKKYLLAQLKAHDISIQTNVTVREITATKIILEDQSVVPSVFTIAATGPHPYRWISATPLPCTNGYIQIDSTLRSPAFSNVFAVGDCAHFLPRPLPKAGVYAVREAPYLYKNICALLQETPLLAFTPQEDYLKLITLGNKRAAADKWGWCLRGAWLWHLKHYIDTSFMKRFRL